MCNLTLSTSLPFTTDIINLQWFTFGIPGALKLHDMRAWNKDGTEMKYRSRVYKKRPLATLIGSFCILSGAFICVAGTYVSIKGIADQYSKGGEFLSPT